MLQLFNKNVHSIYTPSEASLQNIYTMPCGESLILYDTEMMCIYILCFSPVKMLSESFSSKVCPSGTPGVISFSLPLHWDTLTGGGGSDAEPAEDCVCVWGGGGEGGRVGNEGGSGVRVSAK